MAVTQKTAENFWFRHKQHLVKTLQLLLMAQLLMILQD